MPKAISDDLRWRIIWRHYFNQEEAEQVAKYFYVSVKTVKRLTILYNHTGNVAPTTQKHGPKRVLTEAEELTVLNCLLGNPGVYLEEVQQNLFDKCGTWVSKSTLCRGAKRMGLNRKKMRKIATQRSDITRASFMLQVETMHADMFVWVDETGSDKRNAMRHYAYSLRGVTPINYCPYIPGRRISAISAITTRGVEDVYLAEGGVNGETFCDFIRKCLLPIIQPFNCSNPRSIVVLDNASIHHVDEVLQLLHGTGALLWFLPAYSPDLNPIEELFSEVKSYLENNSIAYRVCADPHLLVYAAFASVTPEHCLGYIHHAGYRLQ